MKSFSEYCLHIPEATLYFAKNPVLAPLGNFLIARSLGYDIFGGAVQHIWPAANHALKDGCVWAFSGIYGSTGSALAANFASFSLYFSAQVLSLAVIKYPVAGVWAAGSVALNKLHTLAMDKKNNGRNQLLTSMGVLCVSGALSAAATSISPFIGAVVIGFTIDIIAAQCFTNKGFLQHNKVDVTSCISAFSKGVELFGGGFSSSFWHDVDYLCKLISIPGFLVADSKHWGNFCTLMSFSKGGSNANDEQSKLLRTTISSVFTIFAEAEKELEIQIVNAVISGLSLNLNECKIQDGNIALVMTISKSSMP